MLTSADAALIEKPVYSRIKIENVKNYAFGLDDKGTPQLWAAGKAGWYEIQPSGRYLQYYNDTVEAIDLFYFMVDQQQKLPKKRQRFGFMVDPFLTQYQKHTGYRINNDDDAMETIHKHHKFLLKQMIEEREGIDWSQTYLWKHLLETYAEEVDQLRLEQAELIPTEVDVQSAEPSSENENAESEEESEEEDDDEAEAEEEESDSGSTPGSDTKSASSSGSSKGDSEPDIDWTKTIWDLVNVLRKSPNVNMRQCGIEQVASELCKLPAFEPKTQKAAVKAIERSASKLIRLMDEAKLRKKFNWSTRVIYDELEAIFAGEVADEVIKTPAAKGNAKKHRTKSVLRPSGAGKAQKRTRGVPDSQDEDEDMPDVPITSPVANRKALPPAHRRTRDPSVDTATSREDSPSRQLNGGYDPHALPELPPGPEAQEMLDLINQEAKRTGRQHQTTNLKDFLEHFSWDG